MFKNFLPFLLCVQSALGANILYISPVPSPSHHIWNRALAFGLAHKGHNVTFISVEEDNTSKPTTYSHILMEGIYDEFHEAYDINEMMTSTPAETMFQFEEWCMFVCELSLKTKGFQNLLNYSPDYKFDLIIYDVTTGPCLYPFIHRFNYPPSIAVTPFLLPTYVSYNFGNQLHPTFIPWYGLPYTTNMNFMQRVWNFLYTYADVSLRYNWQYKIDHKKAKEAFGENIPSMEELERHFSLVLTNTDPILDHPQPLSPHLIPVGGLHTRKSKNVSQDLQTLLDTAKNGVILFSLGTNIRSDKLDKDKQKALINAFSKIRETVIWKFESEIENLPKNVIVRKWLPQNDILGHPNVKLFIGHGGALSTQESIFHGVPMICIPFIVDQHINTRMIVEKKVGIFLDFYQITTDYVLQQLREALGNPTYANNMQKLSNMFKDRTETPLERGIFWIEYVIRHGGAEFLNTPTRDFSFFKSTGLDVLSFLVLIAIVIVITLYKLIRFVLKFFTPQKKVKIN